jgi:hypothetical protein
MKKQILIRVLMAAMIVVAAFFVIAAVRPDNNASATEECSQDNKEECLKTKSHSEFLLESITRHLLR